MLYRGCSCRNLCSLWGMSARTDKHLHFSFSISGCRDPPRAQNSAHSAHLVVLWLNECSYFEFVSVPYRLKTVLSINPGALRSTAGLWFQPHHLREGKSIILANSFHYIPGNIRKSHHTAANQKKMRAMDSYERLCAWVGLNASVRS